MQESKTASQLLDTGTNILHDRSHLSETLLISTLMAQFTSILFECSNSEHFLSAPKSTLFLKLLRDPESISGRS